MARAHLGFGVCVCAAVIVCWKTVTAWAAYALHNESGSHILLIPLIIGYLLFAARHRIFSPVKPSIGVVASVFVAIGGLYWLVIRRADYAPGSDWFSAASLAFFLVLFGAFLCCYGLGAARAAAFPLGLLVLMVPLPDKILNWTIHLLQQGSTDIAYVLFNAAGVPVLRNGFLLSLPTLTIEVAAECSGIRSSIALLITCLLAAYFYLRTPWKRALFLSLVIPVALVKNGIRIVTLSLLSMYVDRRFLTGRLHHEGGVVFFVLALFILYPVLRLLEKSEVRTPKVDARTVSLGQTVKKVSSSEPRRVVADTHDLSRNRNTGRLRNST